MPTLLLLLLLVVAGQFVRSGGEIESSGGKMYAGCRGCSGLLATRPSSSVLATTNGFIGKRIPPVPASFRDPPPPRRGEGLPARFTADFAPLCTETVVHDPVIDGSGPSDDDDSIPPGRELGERGGGGEGEEEFLTDRRNLERTIFFF